MKLPIATLTSADVLRAARRCRMDLSGILGEPFSADGAFAFVSSDLPATPSANCVELSSPLKNGQNARIDAEFEARAGRCLQWTAEQREEMLIARGAVARELIVCRLSRRPPPKPAGGPMILQARGALAKAESLLHASGMADEAVRAAVQLIDDVHDEWLIGLQNGHAIAAGAMLISGDAGLAHHLTVLPGDTNAEASRSAVLDRLLDYASRAGLRHVLTCCEPSDVARWQAAGFVEAGRLYEHVFG